MGIKNKHVFGIDLGTTNSAISVYIGSNASEIIALKEGNTIQSCVMWRDGEFIVGREAYENRYKPNVIYSVKRKMGTDEKIVLIDGKERIELTPEEVSAEIIKELVKQAGRFYSDIKDVTITVPAGFNETQREATKKAGELAGLNVVAMINEPTSASLCYDTNEPKNLLVYDLGGGTFDVSIIKVDVMDTSEDMEFAELGVTVKSESTTVPTYRILANENDNTLGGDDIDSDFYRFALASTNISNRMSGNMHKIQDHINEDTVEHLKLQMEKAKKFLTEHPTGTMHIKVLQEGSLVNGTSIMAGPEDLIKATMKVYNRSKMLFNKAIVESGLNRSDIDAIVLVGGSTKSPIIKSNLRMDFPDCYINDTVNPDESVATGSAIQTAVTLGISTKSVFDVVPQTISVETIGQSLSGKDVPGRLIPIIKKNRPLPASNSMTFELTETGKDVSIRMYQGEGMFKEEAHSIGNVLLEREDSSSNTVTLHVIVNSSGMLELSAVSGGNRIRKELTNVMGGGNNKPLKTSSSPRGRLVRAWTKALIESREGKPVTSTMRKHLDNFEETGNRKSREAILRALKRHRGELDVDEAISKTSIFKQE